MSTTPSSTSAARAHQLALALQCIAIAALIAIADRLPMHVARDTALFDHFYAGVLDASAGGPYGYRVLVPFTIAALHALLPWASPIDLDFALKLLALALAQALLYAYLVPALGRGYALAGVGLFDALTSYALAAIVGPTTIETGDVLTVCSFAASLSLLRAERYRALCALLFVSILNRETVLLLMPAILAWEWSARRKLTHSALALVCLAVPYLGLRLWLDVGDWVVLDTSTNFGGDGTARASLMANLHVVLLLGPLLALSVIGFRERTLFARCTLAIVPPFIAVHYTLGRVVESRLWLPLLPVLIALALEGLADLERRAPAKRPR